MKKIIVIMVLFLLTSGCKNNKKEEEKKVVTEEITCEASIINDNSSIVYTDVLTFEDEQLANLSSNREFSFKNDDDLYYDYLEEIKEQYSNISGVTVSRDGSSLKIDYDIKNMNDEDINIYIEKIEKEELIKQYEDRGYTCK